MKIVEITNIQFDAFASQHPINNYCQTSKYALIMSEYGYAYDYIAMVDDNNTIHAASLILKKRITGKIKYGYAPKGFLINYYDQNLLKQFVEGITKYYREQDFVFIKFNPEIIIGDSDKAHKYVMSYNGNVRIIDELKTMKIRRRLETEEFELMQPRFNVFINLKGFKLENLNRNYRKKIRNAFFRGMSLELGDAKSIDILYNFMKNKTNRPISYYRNFYNVFSKDNSIDLVYIKIDYQKYLSHVRTLYEREELENTKWNEIIQNNPHPKALNKKMNSDKKLQDYKEDIIVATNGLKKHQTDLVAGALVIKYANRIIVFASGYAEEYKHLNPNHFLYYAIMERYKPYFDYCDLNGISGNFEENSPFHGLNQFKLKWNPKVYEYVGEFDLICSEKIFNKLIKTSFIEDEFIREHQ